MLLERAADLTAKIAQHQKLKGAADLSDQLHTRAKQLTDVADRIHRVWLSLNRLTNAGVDVGFKSSDGTVYADKAKDLRALIQADPAAINDPPFDLKYKFAERLTGIAAAADQAMRKAWTEYVANRAAFGSEDVLTALAAVPQFRASVAKIRRCRTDVSALGNSVPTDPNVAVKRIDELVKEHDAAWSELAADDIPLSVIRFMRAAASHGAPLEALTAEVKTWLVGRGLLAAFRIRLG